jgi:dihydrofolate reductase
MNDSNSTQSTLERLQVLVGDWIERVELPGVPAGRMSFEWMLDGQFLLQRSEIPQQDFPDSIGIIAGSGDSAGYTLYYFDSRGVVRTYAMTLDERTWALQRTRPDLTPLDFRQRFSAPSPPTATPSPPAGNEARTVCNGARTSTSPTPASSSPVRSGPSRKERTPVTTLRFEISMSLDGYVTASGVRPEETMGDGGQVLHEWTFGDDQRGREVLADSQATVGASIAGRRTYDLSIPWWGANGPDSEARTPTISVSHSKPDNVPEGGVYTFVSSPEDAVATARALAGGKDVDVFSPSIGAQLLRAGLVDEVRIHLAPVLLGSGTRLLDDAGGHVRLTPPRVVEGSKATHLTYRVIKDS